MRTLTITFGRFDDDLFRSIISGSLVLETLVLDSCYGFEVLDISNDSVKNFVICGYSSEMDTLRINAPHIESLRIKSDFDLKAMLLLNMYSIIQAQLDYSNTKVFYTMEMHEHHQMNEELFKGLILSLSHVKELKVGKSCLESISTIKLVLLANQYSRPGLFDMWSIDSRVERSFATSDVYFAALVANVPAIS
ncbi:hypothetical protein Tco_1134432 [Tanacetum coccineum]